MVDIKALVNQHFNKFHLLLAASAAIAGFNCLAKADYNIMTYCYVYYVWFIIDDKVK
jgi:hypothetical protein